MKKKLLMLALAMIVVLTAGWAIGATGITNNGVPAATFRAGDTDKLVMDFTVTDGGGDTILNTHDAGQDTVPGDPALALPANAGYVDRDGSLAYDLGDEVYGDDDNDGVYTAAADARVDADGQATLGADTPGSDDVIVAGTAFTAFVATDWVYFRDIVTVNGQWDATEGIGIDLDQDGWTDAGEEILSGAAFPAGGPIVYATGSNLVYNDANGNNAYNDGEDIFDTTASGTTFTAAQDTHINYGIDNTQDTADGAALVTMTGLGFIAFDEDLNGLDVGDEIGTDADGNGVYQDEVEAVTIRNAGTAVQADIIQFELWHDTNAPIGTWDAGDTNLGAFAGWDGNSWDRDFADVGTAGNPRFFVTVDMAAATTARPVDQATFEVCISGLADTNGNGHYNANDEGLYLAGTPDLGGVCNATTQTIMRPVTLTDSAGPVNTWWYETITAAAAAAAGLATPTPYTIDCKALTYNVASGEGFPIMFNTNNVIVRGAQFGVDPTPTGARTVAANESIIDASAAAGTTVVYLGENVASTNGQNVTFDGFTVMSDNATGGARGVYANRHNPTVTNNIFNGITDNAVFVAAEHMNITDGTVNQNLIAANHLMANHRAFIHLDAYAGFSITGFDVGGSGNRIESNTFNAGVGGRGIKLAVSTGAGTVGTAANPILIKDNRITTSTVADMWGIELHDAGVLNVTITGNDITVNNVGVSLDNNYNSALVTANGNQIYGNTWGVVNNNAFAGDADFLNNWWGVASGPFHPIKNPGGGGNQVSDYVAFIPYWLSPSGGTTSASNTYNCGAGYYAVGVPLTPANPAPTAVYDKLGPGVQIWGAYPYGVPTPGQYELNPNVDPTRGTWLYLYGTTTIQVEGAAVASPWVLNFPVTGWYLISTPWTTDWSAAVFAPNNTAFENDGAGNVGLWGSSCPHSTYTVFYSNTPFIMNPWLAYWVKVNTAGATIQFTQSTLPPTPFSALSASAMGLNQKTTVSPPPPPPAPVLESGAISVEMSRSASGLEFVATGPAASLKAQVFAGDGGLVVEKTAGGATLTWSMETTAGEPVANGVYLVQISALDVTGVWIDLGLFRVLVLR